MSLNEYNISTATYETIHSENELKTSRTASPQQRTRGHTKMNGRGRGAILPKVHSQNSNYREESQLWSLSLKSEGFVSHISHLIPSDLHQRDELPRCLTLKTNGAYRRTIGFQGTDSPLKGFTLSGTQCKSRSLKVPGPYLKKIRVLIIKCLPETQKPLTTLSRVKDTGRHYFCIFHLPC